MNPVYLDCNATSPIEPEVKQILLHYLEQDFGNEGSRTHEYGTRAKAAVNQARDQIAELIGAQRDEVVFTSGATESNNLALLGLHNQGLKEGKTHLITTSIEHKAVLEPLQVMTKSGYELIALPVGATGALDPQALADALTPETWLVSVMHSNNETGIRQPISEIAEIMDNHPAWFHCDAAQGFGKDLDALRNPRIDLISISGHKIYGPKGIGALITRRRGFQKPPLEPMIFGGGQERGLRPGTLPVPLIAALGKAAELSGSNHLQRKKVCSQIKAQAIRALEQLKPRYIGDPQFVMEHVVNLSIGDLDSEALMLGLKELISISNGSACTSSSYNPSHVLKAMGLSDEEANRCVRISWCHMTPEVDWQAVSKRIKSLL